MLIKMHEEASVGMNNTGLPWLVSDSLLSKQNQHSFIELYNYLTLIVK